MILLLTKVDGEIYINLVEPDEALDRIVESGFLCTEFSVFEEMGNCTMGFLVDAICDLQLRYLPLKEVSGVEGDNM